MVVELTVLSLGASAYDALDTLRWRAAELPDGLAKLEVYNELCLNTYDVDSSGKYSRLMLELAQNLQNEYHLGEAYGYLSRYYIWSNKPDSAINAAMESIYIWEKLDDKFHKAFMNMVLASTMAQEGQYEMSARYFHTSLATFIEIGDSTRITQVLQNLGDVNVRVRFYQNAINYYTQALTIDSAINNTYGLIADHIGLGRVYINKYKRMRRDSVADEYLRMSRFHFDTAYALALMVPNIIEMQQLHMYRAMVYLEVAEKCHGKECMALYDSCEMHCQMLSELRRQYNLKSNQSGIVTFLARAELGRGNLDKAFKYLKESERLIEIEKPRKEIKKELYNAYAQYYSMIGNYRMSNYYGRELVFLLMDYSNDEAVARVAQQRSKMEFDEKIRKHAIEEYEREQQFKAQAERHKIIIGAGVLVLMVITIASLRRWKLNKVLHRKNVMLDEKNYQLVSAKEELLSQNELLNVANKNITDSIIYAKHIQVAVMPSFDLMRLIFGPCMIMFSPCNIVSGDFYWAVKIGRYKALAVADCTGHGVPGAFMSLLGISFLNNIMANLDMNSDQLQASVVLNMLRADLITALRQDKDPNSSLDGIDMAFMLIDSERNLMQYSGACRPLVMIRDGELTMFEPDRMPIGIHGRTAPFTNHTIEIQSGDYFYAYSDGITDQFSNTEDSQKFGRNRLYEMLLNNYKKSFGEQLQICKSALNQWRQLDPKQPSAEQTDDVLLVGIKIG
jgi:serine phosphatase RsbU (regulator of sigma subunit)